MAAQKNKATTQKFIGIENIEENVVIIEGGNACSVIEINATNFSLLSKEEQDTKIFSYASLLNSLSFPIQILIRSKRLDITSYLRLLDTQAEQSQNPALSSQIRLYRDFVKELVKVNTVLDKKFYIVIPYNFLEKGIGAPKSSNKKAISSKDEFVNEARGALRSKTESLHAQLARLNLRARTLEKEELVKLFYEIYNGEEIETNQATDNIKTTLIKAKE
ncbi:MAG: hypothetical protein HYT08_03210 [Candidatus Levybacteria bacterium]|nr:hypothetical protein [Candidatus Levybacteria bacterium]